MSFACQVQVGWLPAQSEDMMHVCVGVLMRASEGVTEVRVRVWKREGKQAQDMAGRGGEEQWRWFWVM